MSGDNRKLFARFIGSHEGAPTGRCACCIRTATHTVVFEYTNTSQRIAVACCKRHANMASKALGRFLAQRANRDRHFAETLAAMAQHQKFG